MGFKNIEMEMMAAILEKHLERRDIIGYAAAKNINALHDEARVYLERKDALIQKYGEQIVNENGIPTPQYRLEVGTEGFDKYQEEIETFANQEGDPRLFMIKPEDVIGNLSGTEILELHWMIEG